MLIEVEEFDVSITWNMAKYGFQKYIISYYTATTFEVYRFMEIQNE